MNFLPSVFTVHTDSTRASVVYRPASQAWIRARVKFVDSFIDIVFCALALKDFGRKEEKNVILVN